PVAELRPHPGPEQRVVVDDEHAGAGGGGAHARPASRSPLPRGIRSVTSVPSPGTLRMLAEPPCLAILPWIDSDTPLRSAGTAAGSNPRPLSRTNSDTSPVSTSANSDTTAAPDHFTALTVASRAAASSARRSSSSGQSP